MAERAIPVPINHGPHQFRPSPTKSDPYRVTCCYCRQHRNLGRKGRIERVVEPVEGLPDGVVPLRAEPCGGNADLLYETRIRLGAEGPVADVAIVIPRAAGGARSTVQITFEDQIAELSFGGERAVHRSYDFLLGVATGVAAALAVESPVVVGGPSGGGTGAPDPAGSVTRVDFRRREVATGDDPDPDVGPG